MLQFIKVDYETFPLDWTT